MANNRVPLKVKVKPNQKYEGSATRSVDPIRRDLIPTEAITALGRRLALGAERHGENNWKSGGPEFRKATLNHLLAHIFDYMANGNASEANTDAIICNAAFLCHFEKMMPYKPEVFNAEGRSQE